MAADWRGRAALATRKLSRPRARKLSWARKAEGREIQESKEGRDMSLGSLNLLAVMAAAVASFVFGGVWYSAFSRQWLEAAGMPPERIRERGGVGLYVLAFAAQLVMALMLAGILLHLAQGGVPPTIWNGIVSGAFVWLGFVITTMVANYAFHGASHILTLIDGGHWLGTLVIQGAILGGWGLR
jgi:hypothetical protein